MNWTKELEDRLIYLREEKKMTYKAIAEELGTTIASVKHKYIRLKQAANDDKHHHPIEKTQQVERILGEPSYTDRLNILETNAGWGNLTDVYLQYGNVVAQDIDGERVEYLINRKEGYPIIAKKCDSFVEIHNQVYKGMKFDVVDLDPYGYPSRFFPHVLELIDDGYLFVTFPKIGVQQINKITTEHLRVFWGLSLDDVDNQEEIIHEKMKDYGMRDYRSVELVDTVDLGRMFRFVYKVKKESALDLVGLKVKGKNA